MNRMPKTLWRCLAVAGAATLCHADEPPAPSPKDATAAKNTARPSSSSQSIDPQAAGAAAAAMLEGAYEGERPPEAVRMLAAILRGSSMGPNDGWFGPAQSRYSWEWLAKRCGVDSARGAIPRAAFRGTEAFFARLDRDRSGVIAADDFDWSERSPYLQAAAMTNRLFRQLNAGANGRLTKDELLAFFDKAAQGKDHLSIDEFRDALVSGMFNRSRPSDGPTPPVLIRGLFAGDLGSMNEGPKLNDPAPDFSLKTVDGKVVELAKLAPGKPVVLVFGSFT